MKYIEYGKENKDVIILLHGGGLSWWNYKEVAEKLSDNYHIVLPILDGHAGSDDDFVSIEDNAKKIINFIDEKFGGKVLLIGGLSLGGQILLEIMTQRIDISQYALIESALVIPSKLTYFMVKPAFGSCYGLIKYKWFAKLQFKYLRIKPDLFDDYYKDTCYISKKNMIAFLEANSIYTLKSAIKDTKVKVYIFNGEKEIKSIKKSSKLINEKILGSTLNVLPKLYHGEFSINYPMKYVDEILKIINQ